MSQIDVKNAKVALAHRLRMWECPGDVSKLAAGFIDDLVAKGWQMAPFLESRPVPPRGRENACGVCGKSEERCKATEAALRSGPGNGADLAHTFRPDYKPDRGAPRPAELTTIPVRTTQEES